MATNYQVIAQRWINMPNAAGQFVKNVEVTAQTPAGTAFTVDIPDSQYNIDTVKAVLEEKAASIIAIESL
jgi:hypothetical protein